MERDVRRDQGEWRGCHNFDKIICDGDQPTSSERRGGLKMGQRWYNRDLQPFAAYYNSLSFSSWPDRQHPRCAVRASDKTKECLYEFTSTQTTRQWTRRIDSQHHGAPPVAAHRREFRIASASAIFPKRATRSVSPAPSWTGTARRFLGFKSHTRERESDRGRMYALNESDDVFVEEQDPSTLSRSATPSGSIRSRDMSPESLRRFLSDDLPPSCATPEPAPSFSIPDDIEEEAEDNDDDDNFATNVPSENNAFTNLSPPPFQRGGLSAPPASHSRSASVLTPIAPPPRFPMKLDIPRSHSTESAASSSIASAASHHSNVSQSLSQFSFFDDSEDEEDLASYEGDRTLLADANPETVGKDAPKLELRTPITSYSLPQASTDIKKDMSTNHALNSPAVLARSDNDAPVDANNFFGLPNVDISLDDLVGDANWMNDVIREKAL
ncbi:hypothetical protein O1611_g111 [Lasiodiplodia mahajangana]|uniref:Uncharacterized protein n=1 Tax=Lasiodiplodia mahajangana TaxID=1108764 RepID=A0ACC2K1S3_9PEZI|nr:hypothetical protein O1611_g111 [Lasiodiplodia mahajangana]